MKLGLLLGGFISILILASVAATLIIKPADDVAIDMPEPTKIQIKRMQNLQSKETNQKRFEDRQIVIDYLLSKSPDGFASLSLPYRHDLSIR